MEWSGVGFAKTKCGDGKKRRKGATSQSVMLGMDDEFDDDDEGQGTSNKGGTGRNQGGTTTRL